MTETIVYVNSAHEDLRYVKEAARSAASFRKYYPSAEFLLFTDAKQYSDPVFDRIVYTDFVVPDALAGTTHKNGQMVAKLNALPTIESDHVMYLGSDTHALRPEAGLLFKLLDRFDICAAHAPHRINTAPGQPPIPDVPACFPEFNCDLVVWRRSAAMTRLLEEWRDMYVTNTLRHRHDQGAFRLLAYRSDLRIATLPPEYNYRESAFRKDVVILQNRDELPKYLDPVVPSPRLPLPFRVVNRGLRSMGSSLRISR
jgi:hypothetical protein